MIKINTLELENIKRIKAVQLKCSDQGLTIIGGNNDQGKTSVLDAICWGVGGDRFKPSTPDREESVLPASIRITLDNGLVVERKGKNGTLKVTDPEGNTSGQTLLNKFISQFALDLPKFLNSNSKDKAQTLLQITGIGDELEKLEQEEKRLYSERHAHGQLADKRKKYAEELPYYEDAPKEPASISKLIQKQQTILAKNGENQEKRKQHKEIKEEYDRTEEEIRALQAVFDQKIEKLKQLEKDLETSTKTVEQLNDESTSEIEKQIKEFEQINEKVTANQEKENAHQEAETMQEQYNALSQELEDVRKQRIELLEGSDLPLPELTVEEGELIYKGQKWDCMSGSEQLRVATAIVRKLNPECGFVLMDKLEQLDIKTLTEFGDWAKAENLQIIATRVSTGDECSIVIEDGKATSSITEKPKFKVGQF